jgi:hypothetical protein
MIKISLFDSTCTLIECRLYAFRLRMESKTSVFFGIGAGHGGVEPATGTPAGTVGGGRGDVGARCASLDSRNGCAVGVDVIDRAGASGLARVGPRRAAIAARPERRRRAERRSRGVPPPWGGPPGRPRRKTIDRMGRPDGRGPPRPAPDPKPLRTGGRAGRGCWRRPHRTPYR